MLNAKVTAVVAAVLVMSSVSAQAIEFGDRPGIPVVRSMQAVQVTSAGDLARRQIDQPKSLLGADRQTMVILNSIFSLLSETEGRGRLSAEFSQVAVDFGNFERRTVMSGRKIKDISRRSITFADRPGLATARINPATLTDKLVDRVVTSSVRSVKASFGRHSRPKAAEFCVGSIAPCGSVSFAQQSAKQDS
jgi:hypothetical protein